MCIRPILLSACPVWSNTWNTNYTKIQKLQNKCLRMILNLQFGSSTEEMHKTLNIPRINDIVNNVSNKFCNEKLNKLEILIEIGKTAKDHHWLKHKVRNQIILNKQSNNTNIKQNKNHNIKSCKVNIIYKRSLLS